LKEKNGTQGVFDLWETNHGGAAEAGVTNDHHQQFVPKAARAEKN